MKHTFAVIFDMDGVVVDNYAFHKAAWTAFCEKYGLDFEKAFRAKVFGGTNRDHLETFFERSLTDEEVTRYESEKESLYRQLYEKELKVVDGLPEFLMDLQHNAIPVALATSSPAINVRFVLTHSGLQQFFPVILDASHVKHGKPHPEIYRKAAAALGTDPGRCLVFEDSRVGIQSAQAAGAKVVGVATTLTFDEMPNVDLVIKNFKDLETLQLQNLF